MLKTLSRSQVLHERIVKDCGYGMKKSEEIHTVLKGFRACRPYCKRKPDPECKRKEQEPLEHPRSTNSCLRLSMKP